QFQTGSGALASGVAFLLLLRFGLSVALHRPQRRRAARQALRHPRHPAAQGCETLLTTYTRLSNTVPIAKHSTIGSSTASTGLNPYSRLAGPSMRWTMVNASPMAMATKTRDPMVALRRGPNTKETANSTSEAVASGCSSFFQKAR